MAADTFRLQIVNDAGTVVQTFDVPQNKLDATAAPAVTDDDAAGYVGGSLWVDRTNDKVYVCTDNATGAAVWGQVAGAGAGSGGTVTSVGLALPAIFTVSGSPVTTSGTLTGALATQTANLVFAGPVSGAAAAPAFRLLSIEDMPGFDNFVDLLPVLATDSVPGYSAGAVGNREFHLIELIGLMRVAPGGRLTLTSGTPVTTADVTGATTLYYTPHLHDMIVLYDSADGSWKAYQFAELSLALGTLTSGRPYDVFAYLTGSPLAPALELLAWTNGTTRATAVTLQDGRYCKSGSKTRLYLGTFYTTATTTTEDSATRRFVWNAYNRRPRKLAKGDTTASWTYSTQAYRQARADATNKIEVVVGLAEDVLELTALGLASSDQVTGWGNVGIGKDSTTADGSDLHEAGYNAAANQRTMTAAYLRDAPAAGYHYYAWLEQSVGAGTTTWYGYDATNTRTGLVGSVWA